MWKLLIVACLVEHGLGRPDVSHILKKEAQRQNSKTFNPLEYLSQQLGFGSEFGARIASRSSNFGGSRQTGSRSFRNAVKPSPFKKSVDFGYTYEKPSDPFDFPINPDANLIKPVSTQAPAYLPPVAQGPQIPADEALAVSGAPSVPSYPGIAPDVVTTERGSTSSPELLDIAGSPEGPQSSSTIRPEQPFSPSGPAQSAQNGYSSPGSTSGDMFTGYPQTSTLKPIPSSSAYPQGSSTSLENLPDGHITSTQIPISQETSSTSYPESQTTTENEFSGYPQGSSSSPFLPNEDSTSSGYPHTSSTFLPDQESSTGSTAGPTLSSTVYSQDSDNQPTTQFSGYSYGPSSTFSPSTSSTGLIGETTNSMTVQTTTEENFSGYTHGPVSSSTTENPEIVSPLTTESTQPSAPILPPNLNEVLGEPIDINELATTTQPTTTTQKTIDGAFIPPKPRPELVVPNFPSVPQTPEQTEQPVTPLEEVVTQSVVPGQVSSTSAPEYLPPDGDTSEKPLGEAAAVGGGFGESTTSGAYPQTSTFVNSDTTTLGYSSLSQETTTSGYPVSIQESTTVSSYPVYDRETTASPSYSSPSEGMSSSSGYLDRDTTTSSGYPEVDRQTSTTSVFQEGTTVENHVGTVEHEITTFGGYPGFQGFTTTAVPEINITAVSQTTVPAVDYQTGTPSSESLGAGYFPASGQPTTSSSVESDYVSTSTAAPEYLPPEDENSTSQYYPPAINATIESLPTPSVTDFQPDQPSILPDSLIVNLTTPPSPHEPYQPQAPVNVMDMITAINGLVPGSNTNNGYLPPYKTNSPDLRIVVGDSTPQPSDPNSSVPESEADGSELQPRVALVESTSEGYSYQVPNDRLPAPVVPSHTLDENGYHYKVPNVPFRT
ncbi:mucin-2-like isoform X2 [Armigeres subalbatus]